MNDYHSYFSGKKITVMGAGLLGGVADICFLAKQGADIIVTDLRAEDELSPSLNELQKYPDIHYTLGRHDEADFKGRDLIIKAPTTPTDSPYVAVARKEGTPITMWAAFFSRFAADVGATIVGVTGTRGKTTVTEMIAHVLRQEGQPVISGGNLPSSATLPKLAELQPETYVVLELDSWKLQGFGEEKISPQIAVFTNFMDDHLNYYKGDRDAYFADKAHIFKFQKKGDHLLVGTEELKKRIEEMGSVVSPVLPPPVPLAWRLSVLGTHNRANAALATGVLRILDISEEKIEQGLSSFLPVDGRLCLINSIGHVKVYNDTTATAPEATIAALSALEEACELAPVLIVGGADKELELTSLAKAIAQSVRAVVYLDGTGTPKLRQILDPLLEEKHVLTTEAHSMEEAVRLALDQANGEGCVLLSPAFASFGMFKNEYDRGNQFVQSVQKYTT